MPTKELTAAMSAPGFDSTRRWLLSQYALLALSALLLFWAFEGSDLDRRLARIFFDPELGVFPLRRAWFLEAVMHRAAKQATYVLVAASLWLCWQGWKGRLSWLPPRNALLAAIGMVAIPAATSAVKLMTARYCPWDTIDFGGYAPYLHLFEAAPRGIKAGQCFPAGHASTGFLWIVWAVALRPVGRHAVRRALLAALLAGGILGTARMLQGAHFLSHTLWTLWLAWMLSTTLAVVVRADIRLYTPPTTAYP
ncbi:phosphatase PAP2 family protein [Thauera aromatica]|uniref:phosphatase PAP2 family protein n=1 Tax=Thauera aromatica TaxID=59405 RepID=UPI001FFC65A9|nr:phosphatase PAP2 family protein [Thauera aromatica]MCK2088245.1 phosphatase PAP2 family protein [Thauera aromatica]